MFKRTTEGYVPQDESHEETFSWIDPTDILITDLRQAVREWDRVKKVRISIHVTELRSEPRTSSANPSLKDRPKKVPRRVSKHIK